MNNYIACFINVNLDIDWIVFSIKLENLWNIRKQVFLHHHKSGGVWLRFIHNIFIIWNCGNESLIKFHLVFSNFHELATSFYLQDKYLDVTEKVHSQYRTTTFNRKLIGYCAYLYTSHYHSGHSTKNIMDFQALCYNCIYSVPFGGDAQLREIKQAFGRPNYPPTGGIDKSIEPNRFPGGPNKRQTTETEQYNITGCHLQLSAQTI